MAGDENSNSSRGDQADEHAGEPQQVCHQHTLASGELASKEQHHTVIKICGVRTLAVAEAAVEAGADVIGLVQVESSPRYLPRPEAIAILEQLEDRTTAVAVFRDQPQQVFATWPGRYIQLHGSESPEQVMGLEKVIIKAVHPGSEHAMAQWNAALETAMLLIDSELPGSGEQVEHERLDDLLPHLARPYFIAGGLTPDNVSSVVERYRPFGVDVSSGVESERGVKDIGRIRAFCEAVRDIDRRLSQQPQT